MKWTRTEEIDFDPNDLPDDVYAELVPQFISETLIGISADGRLYTFNEWDGKDQVRYKQTLQDEMREFAQGNEEDALRMMLAALEEARSIVLAAMPHNA